MAAEALNHCVHCGHRLVQMGKAGWVLAGPPDRIGLTSALACPARNMRASHELCPGCPLHMGPIARQILAQNGTDPDEAELRERRRRLAAYHDHQRLEQAIRYQEQQILAAFGMTPVRAPEQKPGACSGCGMDDLPVKGPAGAGLCRYCDELRILAPVKPPDVITSPERPGLLSVSVMLGALGISMMILYQMGNVPYEIALAALAASLVTGLRA